MSENFYTRISNEVDMFSSIENIDIDYVGPLI